MSENSLERSDPGNSEKDYQDFCGEQISFVDEVSERAKSPKQEIQDRRDGIKRLAILALGLPKDSSWRNLVHRGGYSAYLEKVEEFCKYRERLSEDERSVQNWANENEVKLTKVSGITIFKKKNLRSVKQPVVDKVLLSVTTEDKKWTHQPIGGKRNGAEGPVATILREFGEEASWDAAVQLLRDFMSKKAFYLGCYVQQLPDKKTLLIQSFAMDGKNFDAGTLKGGSDSRGFEWAGRELLEGEKGKDVSLTEQAERSMRFAFGFIGRLPNKFSHHDPDYFGRPDLEGKYKK